MWPGYEATQGHTPKRLCEASYLRLPSLLLQKVQVELFFSTAAKKSCKGKPLGYVLPSQFESIYRRIERISEDVLPWKIRAVPSTPSCSGWSRQPSHAGGPSGSRQRHSAPQRGGGGWKEGREGGTCRQTEKESETFYHYDVMGVIVSTNWRKVLTHYIIMYQSCRTYLAATCTLSLP